MNRICLAFTAAILFSHTGRSQLPHHSNIKFDFSVAKLLGSSEIIEVLGTLYNPYKDTIYFLSTSCDGMQYSLQFDTAGFILWPDVICNSSHPIIVKIIPEGRVEFKAHFKLKEKSKAIRLGFDFYEVNRTFYVDNRRWRIYKRSSKKQNILWANIHSFD